jgi:hypothetical protein
MWQVQESFDLEQLNGLSERKRSSNRLISHRIVALEGEGVAVDGAIGYRVLENDLVQGLPITVPHLRCAPFFLHRLSW